MKNRYFEDWTNLEKILLFGSVILVSDVQKMNAELLMYVTESGIVIDSRPVQLAKALSPISVTLLFSPNSIFVRHIQ